MFWPIHGISATSPVETIMDKESFTLEELLEEDEIIQECKAINGRLINFLRGRAQIKQLIQYIVEEPSDDAEKQRIFRFSFIACEIFNCEVDIILNTLVEDEELMDLLFAFLDTERSHSNLLAGYFSKVVVCLLLRKTTSLMNYIRAHQDIIRKLIDLIGITSIMEVLIRLVGADEHINANFADSVQWLEGTTVLEMVADKFSSSDCPEVHSNAAELLCAITRYAPSGLASKISSPSFIGRLFRHALEESRPRSVLVNLLSVCISLLDPKRVPSGIYYMYNRQTDHGSELAANPETVEGMLESLGDLLKLLDLAPENNILLTTYGKLQPPLGKHRLKIVEFISVLLSVSSENAEKQLIQAGAVKRIFELFFEYPYNNFLHHHVERIVVSCLESKNSQFVEHLLCDCNLIGRILEAEKNFSLAIDAVKPTLPAEGRSPPRIGNIGHLTRIANKLVQLENSNNEIQTCLQENSDWVDWQTNVLLKRNALENVFQWACGRPTSLHDRIRDSDDDDYQDRDYDVAALANNLSQAFQYGIYSNDEIEEAHRSLQQDNEDAYFNDESDEVVISSLGLGVDHESGSLFTNSNWFAFEEERIANDDSPSLNPSSSLQEGHIGDTEAKIIVEEDEDVATTDIYMIARPKPTLDDNVPDKFSNSEETETSGSDKQPEWVEWRESVGSVDIPSTLNSSDSSNVAQSPSLPNGNVQVLSEETDAGPDKMDLVLNKTDLGTNKMDAGPDKTDASSSSAYEPADSSKSDDRGSGEISSGTNPSKSAEACEVNQNIEEVDSHTGTDNSCQTLSCEEKN